MSRPVALAGCYLREDGLGVYRFRYKGSDEWHVGFIADEVAELYPDAVSAQDGYLAIDYEKVPA